MRRPESQFVTPAGLQTAQQLGQAVRASRLAMNSTQADFSARARLSRATLARIESGDPAVSFSSWLSAMEEASLLQRLNADAGISAATPARAVVRPVMRQRASGLHGAAAREDAYDF
jgi:transcriptional regulator with XRE-family HTH domain